MRVHRSTRAQAFQCAGALLCLLYFAGWMSVCERTWQMTQEQRGVCQSECGNIRSRGARKVVEVTKGKILTMLSPFNKIRPSSTRLLSFLVQTSSASARVTFINSSKPCCATERRKSSTSKGQAASSSMIRQSTAGLGSRDECAGCGATYDDLPLNTKVDIVIEPE